MINLRRAAMVLPALLVIGLAGCAGQGGSGADEIVFLVPNETRASYESLVKEFNESQTSIEVRIDVVPTSNFAQVLSSRLQGTGSLDLFYASTGTGDPKSVIPLGDAVLDLSDQAFVDAIPEFAVPLVEQDGKVYGWPTGISGRAVLYNAAAYDAADVTVPKTMGDLIDACSDLGPGKSLFALGGQSTMPGLLLQAMMTNEVYGPDPTWDAKRHNNETTFAGDAGWQRTMDLFQQMIDAGCFPADAAAGDFDSAYRSFADTATLSAAFITKIFGNFVAAFEDAGGDVDSLSSYVLPSSADGEQLLALSAGDAVAVNAKTTKKDAALTFLDWFAAEPQANRFAEMTDTVSNYSTVEDADELSPLLQSLVPYMNDAERSMSLVTATWPPGVYEALLTYSVGMLTGQTTGSSVLAELDKAWDEGSK